MASRKSRKPKERKLGAWTMQHGGLRYEARIYEDQAEVVVIDEDERVEVILACGLKELKESIGILESAARQIEMLPPDLQRGPDDDDEDEDEEEEDEEGEEGEEEEEEEADA